MAQTEGPRVIYCKTREILMERLGFDRTYAPKLEKKHGFAFTECAAGYDEAAARVTLARCGVEPKVPPTADVQARMDKLAAGDVVSDDAALPGDCDYDDLVKQGKITYALAKVREQVISEKIANETKRVELEKARGSLVPKDSADRAAALVRDSITQKYERSIARALGRLPSVSAELRAEILTALQVELDVE